MSQVIYGDYYGGDRVHGDKHVYGDRAQPRRAVVTLMSANSADRPLRIDIERREIGDAVAKAGADRLLKLRPADAVRRTDLHSVLLDHRPTVVHFSGHGNATTGIMLADESIRRDLGEASGGATTPMRPARPEALTDLFGILSPPVLCVVLNACYTEPQARAIAVHVPFVIGMRGGIQDDAAISFATAFYRAIAHGESIRTAFRLGRSQLALENHPDAGRPQLITRPGATDRPIVSRPRG